MTIKQHGGVFGRNPKFNSIEAESLSIAGNAVPDASTILVDGDIGSTVQGYDADTAKLDAAQTFTAAQTFNENIVMANGKGIDFSATGDGSGTMDNELFDDYEEGAFTITTAGDATGVIGINSASYVKVGNIVHVKMGFSVSTNFTSTEVGGLPYAVAGTSLSGTQGAGITAAPHVEFSFNGSEEVSFATAPNTTVGSYRLSFTYQTS